MKTSSTFLLALFLLLVLSSNLSSCKKHEEVLPPCVITDSDKDPSTPIGDPKAAIIGKWASTKSDIDMSLLYPNSYVEHQPDSVFISYIYRPDNKFYRSTYWLTDTVLYYKTTYYTNEGDKLQLTDSYRYKFLDYNRLQLDNTRLVFGVSTYFYKRIKCANQK